MPQVFLNPTVPNAVDYLAFLLGGVGIPSEMLPADFTGVGTLLAQSTTLSITSVSTGSLYSGGQVSDQQLSIPINTTLIFPQLSGTPGGIGTYEMSSAALTTQAVPEPIILANSQVAMSLQVATETVDDIFLPTASPTLYVLAVYNLAADRLYNFAVDIPDQTYFQDKRREWRLTDVSVGVVSGSGDQGTYTSLLNPEQMKLLTLQDLQTLKTFYGRQYMALAQKYGVSLWGVT